jgi:hypothetical protein
VNLSFTVVAGLASAVILRHGTNRTENISSTVARSLVAEETFPNNCYLATAVALPPAYISVTWRCVHMSQKRIVNLCRYETLSQTNMLITFWPIKPSHETHLSVTGILVLQPLCPLLPVDHILADQTVSRDTFVCYRNIGPSPTLSSVYC